MELSEVVPWGKTFKEYRGMFSLSDSDLEKTILGCSDGPACFNENLTNIGGSAVSVDPRYQFNSEQIRSRIDEVYPQIMKQVTINKNDYVWNIISGIEELGQIRMEAMRKFLDDYEAGKESGRYLHGSLPILTFEFNLLDQNVL